VVLVVMLVVVVLKVMVLLSLHLVLVVFGLRKKNREGFRRLVHAATAKSPGATSRFYQKMIVDRCNCCYR
jgi:hypothetical protein